MHSNENLSIPIISTNVKSVALPTDGADSAEQVSESMETDGEPTESTEMDLSIPIVTDTQSVSSVSPTPIHSNTYHFRNQRVQSTRYMPLPLISSLVSRFLIKTYTEKNEKRH